MSTEKSLTVKQQSAINTNENEVLVTAAAGSGKTTVLAQRIASILENDPSADISRMLIMTFTNAAAREMKRRITKELKKRADSSGDARLKIQAERVEFAPISTYHSFCTRLLRENCVAAQTTPNFRLLDDSEAMGLMLSSLRDCFDTLYEIDGGDPLKRRFISLLSRYSKRSDDRLLMDIIIDIYKNARTHPDWRGWLFRGRDESEQKLKRIKAAYEAAARRNLQRFIKNWSLAQQKLEAVKDDKFKIQLQKDSEAASPELLKKLQEIDIYAAKGLIGGFKKPAWQRGADTALKGPIEILRKNAAENLKSFLNSPVFGDFDSELKKQYETPHMDVETVSELVELFHSNYSVKKKERNALDFDDVLQKALLMLKARDGVAGEKEGQTGEASFNPRFSHIFVDEYQDTNPIQEEIVESLRDGKTKVFRVGDRKQCIYRFNYADPGIFKRREEAIENEKTGEVIRMNDNFRSDNRVIDAVNGLMEIIMSPELGEIEYNENERLICGNKNSVGAAEILICTEPAGKESDELQGDDSENAGMSVISESAEADMIAAHMEKVLNEKNSNGENIFAPKDVAVLLRKNGALMPQLLRALERRGISAVIQAKSSSDPPENELFINLLRLVQNKMRNIPLVSVMRSPIGNFTDNDLAKIRIAYDIENKAREGTEQKRKPSVPFYKAAYKYANEIEDDLALRLNAFFDGLEELTSVSRTYALEDFIMWVAEKYAFDTFFSEVKNGNSKREAFFGLIAQLKNMTAYTGNSLYLLLCELDALKKKNGKYASEAPPAASAQAVRIMTMHNSKGLEFPVTYVAGLGSRGNISDLSSKFLTHGEEGVCARHLEAGENNELINRDTYEYGYVQERIKSERRSEEVRLMYVAMTRAKNRLYLTGKIKGDRNNALLKWREREDDFDTDNILDLIMRANVNRKVIDYSFENPGESLLKSPQFDLNSHIGQVAATKPARVIMPAPSYSVQAKMSVSAIKRSKGALRSLINIEDEDIVKEYEIDGFENGTVTAPSGSKIKGAALGTLMHRLVERMVKFGFTIEEAVEDMHSRLLIDDAQKEACIKNRGMAEGFYNSQLYKRLRASDRLITEKRFFLKMAAKELGFDSDLLITVQGGLDAAFIEDGEWVLIDYKTDNIRAQDAKERAKSHQLQLEIYAHALQKNTGIPVREKHLYFLRPNCDLIL